MVLSVYDMMRERGYGKIVRPIVLYSAQSFPLMMSQCVAGYLSGSFVPENMVSYSFMKVCIDTLTTSLLVFAAPCGVDIMCVQPEFIGAQQMQGSTVGQILFGSAEEFAARLKEGVEKGSRGNLIWPGNLTAMYAIRGVFYCGDWECYYRFNLDSRI